MSTPELPLQGHVIIVNDYFNALYFNGRLVEDGRPDDLDDDVLLERHPRAETYLLDDPSVFDGMGYPQNLADVPTDRLRPMPRLF